MQIKSRIFQTCQYSKILRMGVRVSQLAENPTLFPDWCRSLNEGKGAIIWLHRKGRGTWKTLNVINKMSRYMLINSKISFIYLFSSRLTFRASKLRSCGYSTSSPRSPSRHSKVNFRLFSIASHIVIALQTIAKIL